MSADIDVRIHSLLYELPVSTTRLTKFRTDCSLSRNVASSPVSARGLPCQVIIVADHGMSCFQYHRCWWNLATQQPYYRTAVDAWVNIAATSSRHWEDEVLCTPSPLVAGHESYDRGCHWFVCDLQCSPTTAAAGDSNGAARSEPSISEDRCRHPTSFHCQNQTFCLLLITFPSFRLCSSPTIRQRHPLL